MINIQKLSKEKVYIIGVSGGPDSMALLDMCRCADIHMVVAHMNYQKRDTALRDEQIVAQYCAQYGIPYHIQRQNKPCKGNFQAFAREARYQFYHRLLLEHQGSAVLLAHQLDDHLETYLMQKERASEGVYYGIQEETELFHCPILRPLMSYTKQELLTYCIEHHVPYGVDESNLSDAYTRNRIRHTQIEPMSKAEKQQLAQCVIEENAKLAQRREATKNILSSWQQDVSSLLLLTSGVQEDVLRQWILQESGLQISGQALRELIERLPKANNWTKALNSEYGIDKDYGILRIHPRETISYAYVLQAIEYIETPYFCIKEQGKSTEAVTLYPSDFPITIRNVQDGDTIQLRFGNKRIHRWFIDRKIQVWERKRWPVVVNAFGKVILVPQIGCDIAHFSNNPSIFVVK